MKHTGVLKLYCDQCRYVVKRWHIPVMGVDCNSNPKHKQAMINPPARSRAIPEHLLPYLSGKQYERHPRWRQERVFQCYSNLKFLKLR